MGCGMELLLSQPLPCAIPGVIDSPPLPLLYHNMIVEHLIGKGGGGTWVINGSPSPLVYHNRIVKHLIGGKGGGEWGD